MAAKRLTSADVVELLAARSGLTVEQVKALLQAQAELSYSNAVPGYPIPGIGVLAKVERPERRIIMRFGPKQGQEVTMPASRRLTFQLSRLAILMTRGSPNPMLDLFRPVKVAEFKFSSEAAELTDPSMFLAGLGAPFTLARDQTCASVIVYRLPDLHIPTGRILAADILLGGGAPFTRPVPPGRYPLALVIARLGTDERVALAIIRFSDKGILSWEVAVPEGQDASAQKSGRTIGYGVDSGTGSFCDASVEQLIVEANEAEVGFYGQVVGEMRATNKATRNWVHIESRNGSLAIFSSGYGDGSYTSYFGLDEMGNPVALVTDFGIVNWPPVSTS
jgi:hypothetical protein